MTKILVTGADGYIGTHVIQQLSKLPNYFSVIAATLDGKQIIDAENITYKAFNFLKDFNKPSLYEEFNCPEICIHLAWRDGFNHNAVTHIEDFSNHFGFLKNLADHGTAQFVVAGSFREYGAVNGMTDIDSFNVPSSMYMLSKLMLKRALELYFNGKAITLQWLRPFTVYGDEKRNHSILSKIIIWENEGKETFPFTDGNEQYDYIEIDQLAKQIIASAAQTEIDGVIDCCTGATTRLGDKVEEFIKENQFRIRPQYGAFPNRGYDCKIVYGDNRKINEIMNKCNLFN